MSDRSRVLVALRVPASAERAFAVFTEQIGQWWRPNTLFQFTAGRTGRLSFEPAAATGPATLGAANGAPGPRRIGPGARLVETYADGSSFVIGHVRAWEPPSRLVLSWRQAGFAADEETELHVRFDEVRDDAGAVRTRVTVEHFGWD
ncbi:MAG: hypothetical protein IRZ08_22655, partial [Frankia sp.]|nr:hypothetical protein [Frankia sp.]